MRVRTKAPPNTIKISTIVEIVLGKKEYTLVTTSFSIESSSSANKNEREMYVPKIAISPVTAEYFITVFRLCPA